MEQIIEDVEETAKSSVNKQVSSRNSLLDVQISQNQVKYTATTFSKVVAQDKGVEKDPLKSPQQIRLEKKAFRKKQ